MHFYMTPKKFFSLVICYLSEIICILFRCMSYFWCGGLTTTHYISQQCCSYQQVGVGSTSLLWWKVFVSSWDIWIVLNVSYTYIFHVYTDMWSICCIYIYIYTHQKSHIYVYHTNRNNICRTRGCRPAAVSEGTQLSLRPRGFSKSSLPPGGSS